MTGPTRAEVLGDLLHVINADYGLALTVEYTICPSCNGEGMVLAYTEEDPEKTTECTTCKGEGRLEDEVVNFSKIPPAIRKCITGFKTGPRGRIIPEMRNKDKAKSELIKAISNGWNANFARDQYGGDAPADAVHGRMPEGVDPLSKEGLLIAYARIARDGDPAQAMTALNQIAKLQGYITEDDEAADNTPVSPAQVQELFDLALKNKGHALPAAADPEPEVLPDVADPTP